MSFELVPLSGSHGSPVISIFNHYIENTLCAYPDSPVPETFFSRLLEMIHGYPAYAVIEGERINGFGFLRPYSPFSTFSHTAEISYFLHPDCTGQGIGSVLFRRLEEDARSMGIRIILASIASENTGSIGFHLHHGFRECGRFEKVVEKKGKTFDVVWMQKEIR